MKNLLDLQLVIGFFFLIIGLLLIGYSLTVSEDRNAVINLWSGLLLLGFSAMMLLSFLTRKQKK